MLKQKIKIFRRDYIRDTRGWFLKVLTGKEENIAGTVVGEVYFTCGYSGQSKGGHYHYDATEWFTCIAGRCILKLVDIDTSENMSIELDGENPVTVCIPPRIAHSLTNARTSDFLVVAYSNRQYEPSDTIPFEM